MDDHFEGGLGAQASWADLYGDAPAGAD